MIKWLLTLDTLLSGGHDCVMVTVAHTTGSAPREAGTKMIVATDSVYGSIGGGNLEFESISTARDLLSDSSPGKNNSFLDLYALGPMLEQCCGGVVFLHYELISKDNCNWVKVLTGLNSNSLKAIIVTRTGKENSKQAVGKKLLVTEFETTGSTGDSQLDDYAITRAQQLLQQQGASTYLHPLTEAKGKLPAIADTLLFDIIRPDDFHIALFGAGHVGSAIISVLANSSPCSITWVDSREGVFPEDLPAAVNMRHAAMPTNIVQQIPAASYYLIMTHSHSLDRALCEAILRRGDFRFLGLIGSQTKKKRFHKHLLGKGFNEEQLSRLTCPIGIHGITSKVPGAIAVSVVAQLLQIYEQNSNAEANMDSSNNVYTI